jgi:hypothetical protein
MREWTRERERGKRRKERKKEWNERNEERENERKIVVVWCEWDFVGDSLSPAVSSEPSASSTKPLASAYTYLRVTPITASLSFLSLPAMFPPGPNSIKIKIHIYT